MSTLFTDYSQIEIVKRDGTRVLFNPTKIEQAIAKAIRAEYGLGVEEPLPYSLKEIMDAVTERAVQQAILLKKEIGVLDIEKIQDIVEQKIMEANQYGVARRYILYREERKRARALLSNNGLVEGTPILHTTLKDGSRRPLDIPKIRQKLLSASRGLEAKCSLAEILEEAFRHLYDGASIEELQQAIILSSRSKIEKEPAYTYLTARLLMQRVYEEVFGIDLFEEKTSFQSQSIHKLYSKHFADYIRHGVRLGRLSPELLKFDLESLAHKLVPARDDLFQYLGLQILYDRYLIHDKKRRIEAPQYFWMRVAMGLALHEQEKEKCAAKFYDVLSQFLFVSSTPTLFNSGTCHPQLSSCYLSTVYDDLDHIFKVIGDNARLSKWAGGIGNDWTYVRGRGAMIKGTNGLTQGIIPFLKVANDTAIAVNQGGKRKGAVCAYLEVWHLDIEDFLELRKNSGDDRRRTHDMNIAAWIPDLFMQRVQENGVWTLFNPCETPDLHDLYGKAFAKRYVEYEQQAAKGGLSQYKTLSAPDLWRKMLTMLFETGHPWITFKDPCNIRSPQSHSGVIHSSNLCTEITLNSSDAETAVCNLGSLNLAAHLSKKEEMLQIDEDRLAQTIRIAMHMLDNVIDINFYPTPESERSNLQHRPVGLGIMGFQDALTRLKIPYDSQKAVEFADQTMELISFHTLLASTELAKERGPYASFKGSKWDQGFLPIDTIPLLEKERGVKLEMDNRVRLDWQIVRNAIRTYGMRNSNTMAIAPTATIAHISGVSPSIEPTYSNLFTRSNLSGEFVSINPFLIQDLQALNLWDSDLLEELKYYDGSVQAIERIPDDLKELYKTAFEIEPKWLIECASRRQKWIDMSQSLNLYVNSPSGKNLSETYFLAWTKGLKTTYYLRSTAATQVEKSTVDLNKKGIQPRWMKSRSASSNIQVNRTKKACSLNETECESCQ
jgi:ribonucleoside-diphosphate reductase alpha chain